MQKRKDFRADLYDRSGIPDFTGFSDQLEYPADGRLLAGRYWLLRKLSGGSSGSIFLAADLHLPKHWAIKEIKKDQARSLDDIKREAALLGGRSHAGLPVAVDFIEEQDACYLVMEYVEGRTLQETVQREGPLSEKRCAYIMRQLADILYDLHSRRPAVYYLDLKPSNVLLTASGQVVLVDFGAAMEAAGAACVRGAFFGTYGYAPPEQCGGQHQACDARSDIYALGATIYYLLTGQDPARPPFGIRPTGEWKHLADPGLIRILDACLKQEPDERFQTVWELREHLDSWQHAQGSAWQKLRNRFGSVSRFYFRFGNRLPVQEKSVFLTAKERAGL